MGRFAGDKKSQTSRALRIAQYGYALGKRIVHRLAKDNKTCTIWQDERYDKARRPLLAQGARICGPGVGSAATAGLLARLQSVDGQLIMVGPINVDPGAMDYGQAIAWLDRRVDFERFHAMPGPERELKLDRMCALLERLGNPQDKLPAVHVAGTKGKGSTSAMLAAVLCSAGYRTGLFTSPHLERVEERIAIDGKPCTAEEFASLAATVRPEVEALDSEAEARAETEKGPTYFEIITAMAFLHFVRQGAEIAVLEVGLGGRLDSTNVCRPLVSVITSISLDHVGQLGDTLAAIAREKAGIIKPGVPVVSGVTAEEPREAIRQIAAQHNSRIMELGADFALKYDPPRNLEKNARMGSMDYCENVSGTYQKRFLTPFSLALLGRHQAANAAIAVAALEELRRQGWRISEESIREGLAGVKWPARIEIVARRPTVVLDSAHNAASIAALMDVLGESFSVARRLLFFGTTRDKDYREMLQLLLGKGAEKGERPSKRKGPVSFFDEIVLTQYKSNPRALPPAELAATTFELSGRHYPVYADPVEAWQYIRRSAAADDLICITGSFFLAGEMRRLVRSPE